MFEMKLNCILSLWTGTIFALLSVPRHSDGLNPRPGLYANRQRYLLDKRVSVSSDHSLRTPPDSDAPSRSQAAHPEQALVHHPAVDLKRVP